MWDFLTSFSWNLDCRCTLLICTDRKQFWDTRFPHLYSFICNPAWMVDCLLFASRRFAWRKVLKLLMVLHWEESGKSGKDIISMRRPRWRRRQLLRPFDWLHQSRNFPIGFAARRSIANSVRAGSFNQGYHIYTTNVRWHLSIWKCQLCALRHHVCYTKSLTRFLQDTIPHEGKSIYGNSESVSDWLWIIS